MILSDLVCFWVGIQSKKLTSGVSLVSTTLQLSKEQVIVHIALFRLEAEGRGQSWSSSMVVSSFLVRSRWVTSTTSYLGRGRLS